MRGCHYYFATRDHHYCYCYCCVSRARRRTWCDRRWRRRSYFFSLTTRTRCGGADSMRKSISLSMPWRTIRATTAATDTHSGVVWGGYLLLFTLAGWLVVCCNDVIRNEYSIKKNCDPANSYHTYAPSHAAGIRPHPTTEHRRPAIGGTSLLCFVNVSPPRCDLCDNQWRRCDGGGISISAPTSRQSHWLSPGPGMKPGEIREWIISKIRKEVVMNGEWQ